MFDEVAKFVLDQRLFLDRVETAYAEVLGKKIQISEKARKKFIASLLAQMFAASPSDELLKQHHQKETNEARFHAAFERLAENPPDEIVCFPKGGLGEIDIFDRDLREAIHLSFKFPDGQIYTFVVVRTPAILERIWKNTVGTDNFARHFPAGEIVSITLGQVVVEEENITPEIFAKAARDWIAAHFPHLANVPLRVLSPQEKCLEEMTELAQTVGYPNLEAMLLDAEQDAD